MRTAYGLIGLAWLILIVGGVYAYNNKSIAPTDTVDTSITSSTTPAMSSTLMLTSPAFENNGKIPSQFTCDAKDPLSPALSISGVPDGTKSLALIMDDPDVPKALKPDGVFDHWILFNIPPATSEIPEGGTMGTVGANGAGKNQYAGPCPPPQYEPSEHRYLFKLYALDTTLSLGTGASKAEVLKAVEGHILAQAELVGRYKRQ